MNTMKRKKNPITRLLLILGMAAMAGCSDGVPIGETPEAPANEWKVMLSRNATNGKNVTVALRYNNIDHCSTLIPADGENPAKWENGAPTWPTENTTPVEVITFCPAQQPLPETITVNGTDTTAYMMGYTTATSSNKPDKFTLKHLMAQLEVHIKISDGDDHHYQPTDGIISLFTSATVNYPGECLKDSTDRNEAFSLGEFKKESNDSTHVENWVNTPQIMIPQTFELGKQCLSFVVNGKTYTFTPKKDITLTAGKKTKLYLGIAYQNSGYVIMNGVTVNDWKEEDPIDVGEMEEVSSAVP